MSSRTNPAGAGATGAVHAGTIDPPRFVVAGASSDVGKTTIAIGLAAAFRNRGLRVVAAKCGPDFIDAAHLASATGRPARNLDPWLGTEAGVVDAFCRSSVDADVAVVEGVMGLFDGRHGSGEGSSAHVARILGAPVVLVLDCAKASSTVGAIAFGLANFDPRIRVGGAILNRVASERHGSTVADAVRSAGIPVIGLVRRDEAVTLPSRHLGLVGPQEAAVSGIYAALAEKIERDVDLDALRTLASETEPLPFRAPKRSGTPVRVAVARDEAFWFYDQSSLDALADAGAELVAYSPLQDPFPSVDAVVVGGGYPELHAERLAANRAARDGLRAAIAAGMPAYAECGGLMYLGRALETPGGSFPMAGAIPAVSTMSARRSALRYVEPRSVADGPLLRSGEGVRGHEFHYSTTRYERASPAFAIDGAPEGFANANVHASYVHLHLGARPDAVERFLTRARAYALRRALCSNANSSS